MIPSSAVLRTPGPSWGLRFIQLADRVVPEALFRPIRALGAKVAASRMGPQRSHSREYLRVVLGREPVEHEIVSHFAEFEKTLMLKLRVAGGQAHRGTLGPGCEDFARFVEGPEDALLGSFHFAHSDLIGFLFGAQRDHRVHMVRMRMKNAADVERLGRNYSRWLSFIWVNDHDSLPFALKDAAAAGGSIVMKCDRLGFSCKTEAFRFLGARRLFPFTIYHLALIFDRPVFLCLGVPGEPGETVVHCTPRWRPDPAAPREANLASARAHFQAFLDLVENLLRLNPYWWLNYIPLNPVAAPGRPPCPA
jgi:predicted LPLAT superfamily acyltransferase